MSSYQAIPVGTKERYFTAVDRGSGAPITSGTVNYYLKAKSGDNECKWWRDTDQTWQAAAVANPMGHEADGHWEIDLTTSPFVEGIRYLEYLKESLDSHIPDARHLIGSTTGNGVGSVKHLLNITSGGIAVQGASCVISTDASQSNKVVGPVYTDPNGNVWVWLDPGDYYNVVTAFGHSFANPIAFTVLS